MQAASEIHPAWDKCDIPARKLHGRNVQIVAGRMLTEPVDFVICWTLNPGRGGTRTGIVAAGEAGIPVFNFAEADGEEKFYRYFREIWG